MVLLYRRYSINVVSEVKQLIFTKYLLAEFLLKTKKSMDSRHLIKSTNFKFNSIINYYQVN